MKAMGVLSLWQSGSDELKLITVSAQQVQTLIPEAGSHMKTRACPGFVMRLAFSYVLFLLFLMNFQSLYPANARMARKRMVQML